MDEYESLSHTTWDCKYHVVFIPKCRRKTLYQELRRHLGEVFRKLAHQKESKVEEGHLDLYFQGLAWFNKGATPDNVAQARSFFDRALTADPGNVDALIGSARVDAAAGALSFVVDPMAALAAAEAKLTKALSLVPDHAGVFAFPLPRRGGYRCHASADWLEQVRSAIRLRADSAANSSPRGGGQHAK